MGSVGPEERVEPRGAHADEPVSLCAAEGSLIEIVIGGLFFMTWMPSRIAVFMEKSISRTGFRQPAFS